MTKQQIEALKKQSTQVGRRTVKYEVEEVQHPSAGRTFAVNMRDEDGTFLGAAWHAASRVRAQAVADYLNWRNSEVSK